MSFFLRRNKMSLCHLDKLDRTKTLLLNYSEHAKSALKLEKTIVEFVASTVPLCAESCRIPFTLGFKKKNFYYYLLRYLKSTTLSFDSKYISVIGLTFRSF